MHRLRGNLTVLRSTSHYQARIGAGTIPLATVRVSPSSTASLTSRNLSYVWKSYFVFLPKQLQNLRENSNVVILTCP